MISPCRVDVHADQYISNGCTECILAETRHAVTVTCQSTIQPQVADLGTFTDTAEESTHTLTSAAGVAVQIGSNGNLVVLGIEGTCKGCLVLGSTDKGITIGAVSSVVNVCCHLGAASIVACIHSLGKGIKLLGRTDGVVSFLVSIGEVASIIINYAMTHFRGNRIFVTSDVLEESAVFATATVQHVGQLAVCHLTGSHYNLRPNIGGIAVGNEVVLIVLIILSPLGRQLVVAILGNHQLVIVT